MFLYLDKVGIANAKLCVTQKHEVTVIQNTKFSTKSQNLSFTKYLYLKITNKWVVKTLCNTQESVA